MDHSRKSWQRRIVRSLALVVGGVALGALARSRAPEQEAVAEPEAAQPALQAPISAAAPRSRPFGARLGVAASFVALFVAGGALTAWGGNQAAQLVEDPAASVAAEPTAAPEAPAADPATTPEEAPVAPELPADEPVAVAAPAAPALEAPEPAPIAADPAPAPGPATVAPAHAPTTSKRELRRRQVVLHPRATSVVVRKPQAAPPAADPEATAPGTASVVWLNQALPDPTPPSRRLQRTFVHELVGASGHDWPLELALLRVQGDDVTVPTPAALLALAGRVADAKAQGKDEWQTALALTGDSASADRAVALSHYYLAVGTETLVDGLRASKARLGRRLLLDPHVAIYEAGRADIEAGRVNERVLAVVAYLADSFGSIEVSSLVSGHRLYARERVLSAHVFGEAVDVAALGGVSIVGHQEPGGLTEQAVRDLLLLPGDVEPRQIISLLGLGGPSFALADHADHIHVGF
jgi:hypothetical protein